MTPTKPQSRKETAKLDGRVDAEVIKRAKAACAKNGWGWGEFCQWAIELALSEMERERKEVK